jgi:hypothetical protein
MGDKEKMDAALDCILVFKPKQEKPLQHPPTKRKIPKAK